MSIPSSVASELLQESDSEPDNGYGPRGPTRGLLSGSPSGPRGPSRSASPRHPSPPREPQWGPPPTALLPRLAQGHPPAPTNYTLDVAASPLPTDSKPGLADPDEPLRAEWIGRVTHWVAATLGTPLAVLAGSPAFARIAGLLGPLWSRLGSLPWTQPGRWLVRDAGEADPPGHPLVEQLKALPWSRALKVLGWVSLGLLTLRMGALVWRASPPLWL